MDAPLLLELLRSSDPPQIVQNRCYAKTGWDYEIRKICREHDVIHEGFSLLTANRDVLHDPQCPIARAARRLGKTREQIVFRFAMQIGMVVITGTTSELHMTQDLEVYDFELTEDEVRDIEQSGV